MNRLSLKCLLLGLLCGVASSQTNGDYYFIGDVYTLSWQNTSIAASDVDVVLYYGDSLEYSWTMATSVPNSGMAEVGADLGKSASQLMIANGTRGQFRLTSKAVSLNATAVTVCQSVLFETAGRAIATGRYIRNVIIRMRKGTYSADATWIAQFASIDEDAMTWSSEQMLDTFTGPTAAPTQAPETTASPGNSSNETSFATATPQHPNDPTTFFSTASPDKKAKKSGLRLADAMSMYEVSLGLQESLGADEECGERARDEQWCYVNMTFKLPDDAKGGGPYELLIGMTMNASAPLQYYGANMMPDTEFDTTPMEFLVYVKEDVMASISQKDVVNGTETFWKYQMVDLNVTLGDGLDNVSVYVVASKVDADDKYYLECGAHPASYFSVWGWRAGSLDDALEFEEGLYQFELYWAAYDDFAETTLNDYYRLQVTLPAFRLWDVNENGTSTPAVQFKDGSDDGDLPRYASGSHHALEFVSSFSPGTLLEGYLWQCSYVNGSNHTTVVGACDKYGNSSFNFTYAAGGNKVNIDFPSTMYDTKASDNSTRTFLNVSATLCDGVSELVTTLEIEIGKSGGGSSSGLSAGAIVGIVCAGVLVLGLAAWWLCMKKGGGDGYRQLDQ